MFSAAGELAYASARFGELTEQELVNDGEGHFFHRLKIHAEERLVKYAKVAADMGVDAARLRIASAQTAMMGAFLEGVLSRIDLTAAQKKQIGPAIRAELTKVTEATGEEIK